MTDLPAPVSKEATPEKLPGIRLSELPETTKDFLLASSLAGEKSISAVITETLDGAAKDAGFDPEPSSEAPDQQAA